MPIESLKILTVGSALGNIRDLFAKVRAINAKHGKFELLLCTGDFFGPLELTREDEVDALLDGSLEAPMPVYLAQGMFPLPQKVIARIQSSNGRICPNVMFLGKSSVVSTAHGLRIGSIGGTYNSEMFESMEDQEHSPFLTQKSLQNFIANPVFSLPPEHPQTLAAAKATRLAHSVDILISHAWPLSITKYAANPPVDAPEGVAQMDDVVCHAKPRYHFAAAGKPAPFWEREPFKWEETPGSVAQCTRFINLGAFGEQNIEKKQRWFYAFSIAPIIDTSQAPALPANLKYSQNPFIAPRLGKRTIDMTEAENFIWGSVPNPNKRARTQKDDRLGRHPPDGYRCRVCGSEEHFLKDCPDKPEKAPVPEGYVCKICKGTDHVIRDCPKKNETGDTGGKKPPDGYICRACGSDQHYIKDCSIPHSGGRAQRSNRGPVREITSDECWFCLSNPKVTKHLIISIGSECYLTLPKGQIVPTSEPTTKTPGGGHALIIPISHYPTLASVPQDLALPIVSEIEQYKSALRSYYAAHGACAVVFEVSRLSGKGGHAHVQVVPIPVSLESQVHDAFKSEGERLGIFFEDNAEEVLEAARQSNGNYFRVDLPDGTKMVHILRPGSPFNLQFGRLVLANLIGHPDRADWKECIQTDDEEKRDALAFRAAFAKYDPVR